jgi:hypothetical protein
MHSYLKTRLEKQCGAQCKSYNFNKPSQFSLSRFSPPQTQVTDWTRIRGFQEEEDPVPEPGFNKQRHWTCVLFVCLCVCVWVCFYVCEHKRFQIVINYRQGH